MGKEILDNVPNQYSFWLANGKGISSVRELYKELKSMDSNVFNFHVNESKNDFYNWIKDVYGNKVLADDLLECTTKEAVIFCFGQHLDKANVAMGFNEMPHGYSREKNLFDDLPKGYPSQRVWKSAGENNNIELKLGAKNNRKLSVGKKTLAKKEPLVTLINLKQIKKESFKSRKINKVTKIKIKNEDDDLEMADKKIKPLDSGSIIKEIKEVYGFE